MTVSSENNKIAYPGNGIDTVFTTPQFLVNPDIEVILSDATTGAETPQVEGSNYSLTGAGNPVGGTVTMFVAPPTGQTLTIKNDPARLQEQQYPEGGDFPGKATESAFDRGTFIDQSQEEQFTRTISFPVTDTAPTAVLPPAQQRAGKVQVFDDFGSPDVAAALDLVSSAVTVNGDTIIDETFRGVTIFVNNASDPITLTFSDSTLISGATGTFCYIVVTSAANPVTVTTAVGGQLRSQPGTAGWNVSEDPIYLGQSLALSDESYQTVIRSTSVWRVDGQVRASSGGDEGLITRASLVAQKQEAGAYTFIQSDAGKEVIFIGTSAETWTIPVLNPGTSIVVHNIGTDLINFATSGTSLIGVGATLQPQKSASLSWLPLGTAVKITGEVT
ncbi:MAG: hypothetical protein ACR2QF_06950 [Geminicoccaceae bacterium]